MSNPVSYVVVDPAKAKDNEAYKKAVAALEGALTADAQETGEMSQSLFEASVGAWLNAGLVVFAHKED